MAKLKKWVNDIFWNGMFTAGKRCPILNVQTFFCYQSKEWLLYQSTQRSWLSGWEHFCFSKLRDKMASESENNPVIEINVSLLTGDYSWKQDSYRSFFNQIYWKGRSRMKTTALNSSSFRSHFHSNKWCLIWGTF